MACFYVFVYLHFLLLRYSCTSVFNWITYVRVMQKHDLYIYLLHVFHHDNLLFLFLVKYLHHNMSEPPLVAAILGTNLATWFCNLPIPLTVNKTLTPFQPINIYLLFTVYITKLFFNIVDATRIVIDTRLFIVFTKILVSLHHYH